MGTSLPASRNLIAMSPASLPVGTALPLVSLTVALLGSLALVSDRRYRGLFGALAVASIPLAILLWANISAAPSLLDGSAAGPMDPGSLDRKLAGIVVGGVVPALVAWAILWYAPPDSPCPRIPLRPLGQVARGAAFTLLVVAGVGLATGLVQGAFNASTALEAGLWSQVDPWMVLGLSMAAAVSEEILFRGVLYSALVPWMGFVGGGLLQAAVFGFVHTGYGDPLYVVAAALFGLLQAYVSVRWGLLVAVMVHAQTNLVILGWASRTASAANGILAVGIVAVNLLVVLPAAYLCVASDRARCPLSRRQLGLPGLG